jgi:hypothetical protein
MRGGHGSPGKDMCGVAYREARRARLGSRTAAVCTKLAAARSPRGAAFAAAVNEKQTSETRVRERSIDPGIDIGSISMISMSFFRVTVGFSSRAAFDFFSRASYPMCCSSWCPLKAAMRCEVVCALRKAPYGGCAAP